MSEHAAESVHRAPMVPCPKCRTWLRRLGRRWWPVGRTDAHRCAGQTVGWRSAIVCDCYCQQDLLAAIAACDGWPTMTLDPPRDVATTPGAQS